jgi:non-homologous end joining protein Ku
MSEEKLSWDEEAKRKFDKALERVVSGEQTEENEASSKYKIDLGDMGDMGDIVVEKTAEFKPGEFSDEMKEKVAQSIERLREKGVKADTSESKEFGFEPVDLSDIKKIKTEKPEVKIKRADIKLPDNFDFSSIKR